MTYLILIIIIAINIYLMRALSRVQSALNKPRVVYSNEHHMPVQHEEEESELNNVGDFGEGQHI